MKFQASLSTILLIFACAVCWAQAENSNSNANANALTKSKINSVSQRSLADPALSETHTQKLRGGAGDNIIIQHAGTRVLEDGDLDVTYDDEGQEGGQEGEEGQTEVISGMANAIFVVIILVVCCPVICCCAIFFCCWDAAMGMIGMAGESAG
jgi:hypothetical protein